MPKSTLVFTDITLHELKNNEKGDYRLAGHKRLERPVHRLRYYDRIGAKGIAV